MTVSAPTPVDAPVRFADLPNVHEHVAVALERAGLTHAFPVQEAVVPVAAEGHDVLVKSPTGSGKTLAFALPIIDRLERGSRTPSAVILVPGRELAIQIREEIVPIAWSKQLRCVAVYGGGTGHKHTKLASGSPIIVATPGRLIDLIRNRDIDLGRAHTLVLDEADRMLDMGFTPQVEEIARSMPKRSQTMLFSATLEGRVGDVARRLTTDPIRIERDELPGAQGQIAHLLVEANPSGKVDALVDLLDDRERDLAVVFVRTQLGAANLCESLRSHGLRATTVHGGMTQPERFRELGHFEQGVCDVLVATDVFARGMDLERITHVVNFELPEDADMYRHRIGRTGRAGRSGTAVTIVTQRQRRVVEGLLLDLGLPLSLLKEMQPGSTAKPKVVPVNERYRSPGEGEVRRASKAERPAPRAAEPAVFEERGNGRGKVPTRTAPARGAQSGGPGRGTIIDYDPKKGFGFIKQVAGGKDVFFHRRAVSGTKDLQLRAGMAVSFSLERGEGKKLKAQRVAVDGVGPAPKRRERNASKPRR